ncbi:hypothetical protein [Candidatus Mycolicibacterium alkanivorans]|uniref:Uncharacterized protein n=1 Tax=Candidatus Mycolicibacterium alkanivorans TaxID=2954114 RepID=A0ABS9YU30_9MYCO|nr:hypothetical protein [Candidatus Mycolicibacterium alkanivorans]MCI4674657.1 hypothetical protein [Candidatus Mycolicibacterium alkanivorans]
MTATYEYGLDIEAVDGRRARRRRLGDLCAGRLTAAVFSLSSLAAA